MRQQRCKQQLARQSICALTMQGDYISTELGFVSGSKGHKPEGQNSGMTSYEIAKIELSSTQQCRNS